MGGTLIVVDDIVTTGSTLTAVATRLGEANMQVAGAAVLAATRLRRHRTGGFTGFPPGVSGRPDHHVLGSPNEG